MEDMYTYDNKSEDHPPLPSSSGLFWKSIQSLISFMIIRVETFWDMVITFWDTPWGSRDFLPGQQWVGIAHLHFTVQTPSTMQNPISSYTS